MASTIQGWTMATLCKFLLGALPNGKLFWVRCGSWDCEICAPINALHWSIRTVEAMKQLEADGRRAVYVTITQNGKLWGSYSWALLHKQWEKLYKRLKYRSIKSGVALDYIIFVEAQSRGNPHLHGIVTTDLTYQQFKKLVIKSGFGYQFDYQTLRHSTGVGWYIAKYCSKTSSKMQFPKGFRRIRTSQGWPKFELDIEKYQGNALIMALGESYRQFVARAQAAYIPITMDRVREFIVK